MRSSLIRHVDPWQEAAHESCHEGALDAARVPRLAILGDFVEPVQASLSFALLSGPPRAVEIKLVISARITTTCQRCLETMVFSSDHDGKVIVVANESSEREMQSDLEVLVSKPGEHIELAALVEDEFLLALPFAMRHAEGQCPEDLGASIYAAENLGTGAENEEGMTSSMLMPAPASPEQQRVQDKASERENPFAVLAQLRTRTEPED